MKITPIDIQEKQFHISLRGYNPEEVDTFLDAIAGELEILHKENNDLKRKLKEVELKKETQEGSSEIRKIMEKTLISAQNTAEEIIKAAKLESEKTKIESEKKSEEFLLKSQDEIREMLDDIQEIKNIKDKLNNSLTEIYNRLSSVLKTEKIYERPPVKEGNLIKSIVEEEVKIEDTDESSQADDESKKKDETELEAESEVEEYVDNEKKPEYEEKHISTQQDESEGEEHKKDEYKEEKERVEEKDRERKKKSFADSEIADKFFDEENIV
mgnify:CR=1 FL=1